MKKFLSEFKEFALRGNVLDMAIGVVIGKYRDGDRKTRQQMKQVLERFN